MAGDESTKPEESWYKRVNVVVTVAAAVVTTVITLLGNYVYNRVTARSPHLEYTLVSTPPLFGSLENSRLYTVNVENSGEVSIADLRVAVDVGPGKLKETHAEAPPALPLVKSVDINEKVLIVTAPEMTPGDDVSVSFLVAYNGQLNFGMDIDVRGRGVLGKRATRTSSNDNASTAPYFLIPLMMGLVSLILLRFIARLGRTSGGVAAQFVAVPDRRRVTFAAQALNLDLAHLAREYLERPEVPTYWLEADVLTSRALLDPQWVDPHVAKQLLHAVLDAAPTMAKSSQAIFWVNIARIENHLNNREAVVGAVSKARKLDERETDKRVSRHPEIASSPS